MKVARVSVQKQKAGLLLEIEKGGPYRFVYDPGYVGHPISLSMPIAMKQFEFEKFPPFFDGLLPEGPQLEGMLRQNKIDKGDYFSQLIAVGADLVGAVTVAEAKRDEMPDHLL